MGGGVNPLPEMQDEVVMSFLRQAGEVAEYVTSVCTGALILAEAGLLKGLSSHYPLGLQGAARALPRRRGGFRPGGDRPQPYHRRWGDGFALRSSGSLPARTLPPGCS